MNTSLKALYLESITKLVLKFRKNINFGGTDPSVLKCTHGSGKGISNFDWLLLP